MAHYSSFGVEGAGVHGVKRLTLSQGRNIEYLVVASKELAARLLAWVDSELLPRHPSIAYCTDATAVAASPLL